MSRMWLIVIVAVAAGCTSTLAPSTRPPDSPSSAISAAPTPAATPPAPVTPTPTGAVGRFAEALSFLTPSARTFFFNDWAAIKESLGAADVTSASSDDEKQRVLVDGMVMPPEASGQSARPSLRLEAVVRGYGLDEALRHAETWKFDVLDYEWEATLEGPPSIHVIRFRPGFDLGQVVALFDEREYATERISSATVRTHDTVPVSWMLSDLAIMNVALLDDGRTMILSYSEENLRAFLTDARAALPAALSATATALGEPWAAAIVVNGADWCADLPEPGSDTPAGQLLATVGPLSPWDALGIGYSRDLTPIGRIAIGYADASAAEQDLAGRRLLAEHGLSLISGAPLATLFAVADASSADGVIRMDVSPTDDWPARLFAPLYRRDLVFAVCPRV